MRDEERFGLGSEQYIAELTEWAEKCQRYFERRELTERVSRLQQEAEIVRVVSSRAHSHDEFQAAADKFQASLNELLNLERWQLAQQLLEWVNIAFDNSVLKQLEAEFLCPDEEGCVHFDRSLNYKVEINFFQPEQEGLENGSLDVELCFEFNGEKLGWQLAGNLDGQKVAALLRSASFAESLFRHVKEFVETKLELTTPPHSTPAAKDHAEKKAELFEKGLKKQLNVHPGRREETVAEFLSAIKKAAQNVGNQKARQTAVAKELGKDPRYIRERLTHHGMKDWKDTLRRAFE